jgi:hypothetical protein
MVEKVFYIYVILIFASKCCFSQSNDKFRALQNSKSFCKGSVYPISNLVPYPTKIPFKYIETSLPFSEAIKIKFFVCINTSGKAQEIHFIEASKILSHGKISYDSLGIEKYLSLKSFVDYIENMEFMPASTNRPCKYIIVFESKKTKKRNNKGIMTRRFRLIN